MNLDMNNIKPKGYMVNSKLRLLFPDSKIIYTIQVYTSGRVWSDWTYDVTNMLKVSQREYFDFMQEIYADSQVVNGIVYFKDMKDCKNAIGNLENLIIMSKLTR
jgi:hypothetical protein